jgi:fatty-acyl-CoA synthase
VPLVDLRVWGDGGEQAWDGHSVGEIQVRGPFITGSYHQVPRSAEKFTDDGWLRTGDVASVDDLGFVRITDRTKDLIKSGGEWISSVDLENALVAHEAVKEAAVIAVAHDKWQERPLAVVVLKDGSKVDAGELRAFLEQRFARWQVPDAFVFISELPHTSTGKLLKSKLRQEFKDWQWEHEARPTAREA